MAIPRFKKENIGSLGLIEYVPFYAILSFVPGTGTIQGAGITLKEGYSWQAINCSQDTMGYQQEQQLADQGESYSQQVVGLVPGDEPDIETGLLDLTQKRFILRITLSNGIRKIVGNPAEPLRCKTKSDTSQAISGRTGTQLNFYGDTLTRSLFLVT